MGVVWRAVDERLERSVAVKQIFTQQGLSEAERVNVRQRAMREAKNAARFQHPNAIVVFDIAEHEGDPCLVMEYLPARSLSAVLSAQGTLAAAEAARIGEQVASALAAAHRAGVVHRDVKPGNILLTDNGTAKITDFGISRSSGDLTLTETGLICGTPAYLAPEVARGSDPSPASDVFALGATLYQALEGRPPYGNNTNQLALLYSAANAQVIAPRQAGQATALLMSLLRPDPDHRPTMAEARARLAALATTGVAERPTSTLPMASFADDDSAPLPAVARPRPRVEPVQAQAAPPRPEPTMQNRRPAATPIVRARFGGNRTLVASAAALLVLLAVIFATLNLSGGHYHRDTPSTQADQSASPTSAVPSTSAAATGAGHSRSAGAPVAWGPAGELISQFYGNPTGSWSLLTAEAQQVYGSQSAFGQYWSAHTITAFSGIHADTNANNADGSVQMRLDNLSYSGRTKSVVLRVVDNGALRIDGDTR
jgi:serine/threonine protein kinase